MATSTHDLNQTTTRVFNTATRPPAFRLLALADETTDGDTLDVHAATVTATIDTLDALVEANE